ncbi:MAG TPA: hypothetical protein PK228_07965 [Saprospiraceae bacterium]|nr:hypothetical protein [Saprospiraceae bacterium]
MKSYFLFLLLLVSAVACKKSPSCDDDFVENRDKEFAPYQVNDQIVMQDGQSQFDTFWVKSYQFYSNQIPMVDCGGRTEGFKCVIQTNWFLPTDSSKKVEFVYESYIEGYGYQFVGTEPSDFQAGRAQFQGNGQLEDVSFFSIGGQNYANALVASCQDTVHCGFFSKIVFSRFYGLIYVENEYGKWWLKE